MSGGGALQLGLFAQSCSEWKSVPSISRQDVLLASQPYVGWQILLAWHVVRLLNGPCWLFVPGTVSQPFPSGVLQRYVGGGGGGVGFNLQCSDVPHSSEVLYFPPFFNMQKPWLEQPHRAAQRFAATQSAEVLNGP